MLLVNDKSLIIDYFYSEIGHLEHLKNVSNVLSDYEYDYVINRIKSLQYDLSNKIYFEAFRFYKNLNSRRKTLSKRIHSMSKVNPLIFVTLTFNEHYIKHKESSLHQYVKIYLNSLNCDWVANKDYGEKKGRLHYHAIVNCEFIDLSKWIYGNIDIERVRCSNDDKERISNYILKFVNHSFKSSTNKYIMYSRKRGKK